MHRRWISTGATMLLASTLAACTSSGQDELKAWMQTERNSIKPSVQPIPEPTKFVPQAYLGERQMQPFSEEKLASVLRGSQSAPVASIRPFSFAIMGRPLSACAKRSLRTSQERASTSASGLFRIASGMELLPFRIVDNRNWNTPISLTRNAPISKAIRFYKCAANSFRNLPSCLLRGKSVEIS